MRINLLIIFTLTILITSCNKAKTEDEVKSMILGTWKFRLNDKGTLYKNRYMIIEFADNDLIQYVSWTGGENNFEQIDPTTFAHSDYDLALSEDSIFYEVDGFNLIFHTTSEMTIENHLMDSYDIDLNDEFEIKKLTGKKLVIDNGEQKWKLEKQ